MYPYVAGEGTRLFDDGPKSYRLDLVSGTAFSDGTVGLHYRRHRQTGGRRARQWQSGDHRSRCERSRSVDAMGHPIERHLLRAKDFVDRHYAESIDVDALAHAAGYSRAHFSRQFRRAFGQPPHVYVLKRRLERAASLLRTTDHSVAEICMAVGLTSVGSFTTSFKRTYGVPPTAYRRRYPPAAAFAVVPSCIVRFHGTPSHVKESCDGVA